ncbi:putative dystrophin, isoform E, partial [Apostichopus japonicus]
VFMSSVSQDEFVSWMMSEPQTFIWLPTLHRLSAAESVKHEAKCNICKCHPMVGFRYQCLKCLNFDICQTCFLTGRSTRHHRYTHPIQEYCLVASSRDEMKAFVRTVRNKVSKKHGRRLKQKYLAIEEDKQTDGQDHQYHHDNHFQTHLHLGQLSKQLEAVELDPVFQSRNQGATNKQNDDSISQKSQAGVKDNLEELIDALEKENENLAAELVNYYQEMQDKQRAPVPKMTSASSSVSSREDEERRVKQEILEEHNKRLEDELLRYRELIRKEQHFEQRPTYHPASLDKTAPPRLEPYGQSEPQLDKIGTTSYNQHASIVSRSSDPMPSMSQSFFRTPANPDLVAPLSKGHTSLVSQSSDPMPFIQSSFFKTPANPKAPFPKDYAISSSDHTPERFPNGSLDALHTHKSAYSSLQTQVVVTADPAVDYNSFRISGVNDRTTSPDGFSFQSRDEPDSQSLTIGNRVWPPHLVDESTVRFPNMSVTRVFPTDEAKLDEMVEKMTAALDHSNIDGHPKADSDTFCAVNRLGEAMQKLVSEITMATNVV